MKIVWMIETIFLLKQRRWGQFQERHHLWPHHSFLCSYNIIAWQRMLQSHHAVSGQYWVIRSPGWIPPCWVLLLWRATSLPSNNRCLCSVEALFRISVASTTSSLIMAEIQESMMISISWVTTSCGSILCYISHTTHCGNFGVVTVAARAIICGGH